MLDALRPLLSFCSLSASADEAWTVRHLSPDALSNFTAFILGLDALAAAAAASAAAASPSAPPSWENHKHFQSQVVPASQLLRRCLYATYLGNFTAFILGLRASRLGGGGGGCPPRALVSCRHAPPAPCAFAPLASCPPLRRRVPGGGVCPAFGKVGMVVDEHGAAVAVDAFVVFERWDESLHALRQEVVE